MRNQQHSHATVTTACLSVLLSLHLERTAIADSSSIEDPASLVGRCEALAAAWTSSGPGVDWSDLDPGQAIPACEQAMRAVPDDPDLKAYLCRALQKAGRFGESTPLCREAAQAGSAAGQWLLGNAYRTGASGERDDTSAMIWYRIAAGQRYAPAYFALAAYAKSSTDRADWLGKAALNGLPAAQQLLGWMYERGLGVDMSDAQAAIWYRKAAEQGNADAQFSLGSMYEEGRGVAQDDAAALTWYRKAAQQSHWDAGRAVGRLSRAETLATYVKAKTVKPPRQVATGHPSNAVACTVLASPGSLDEANHLELGIAVAGINVPLAVAACEQAIAEQPDNGDLKAYLCRALAAGAEFERARKVCAEGADQGSGIAAWSLGTLYDSRIFRRTPIKNDKLAAECYKQASQKGFSLGEAYLGRESEYSSAYSPPNEDLLVGELAETPELLVQLFDDDVLGPAARARFPGNPAPLSNPLSKTLAVLSGMLEDAAGRHRASAAEALGRLRPTAAKDLLVDALNDEDPYLRFRAAEALGKLADSGVVVPLSARLKSEESALARNGLILALAMLGDARVAEETAVLIGHPSSEMRLAAVRGVLALGDEQRISTLVPLLDADPDPTVRDTIAYGLVLHRIPGAVSAVLQAIDRGRLSSTVEYELNEAILLSGDPAAAPSVLERLASDDPEILTRAVHDAATLGDVRLIEDINGLTAHPDASVRGAACFAIAEIGQSRVIDTLVDCLTHPDAGVRRSVTWSLHEIADPDATPALKARMTDPEEDVDVRSGTAQALLSIGTDEALKSLLAFTDDPNPEIRMAALQARVQSNDPSTSEWLATRISAGDYGAVEALGAVVDAEHKETFDALEQALVREPPLAPTNRALVVEGLRATGDPRAVGRLLQIFTDHAEHTCVRERAAEELLRAGAVEAVPHLIRVFANPAEDPVVRVAAWFSLSEPSYKHGEEGDSLLQGFSKHRVISGWRDFDRAVIDSLVSCLTATCNPDGDWRYLAASMLADLPLPSVAEVLLERVVDPDESERLREASIWGLEHLQSETAIDALGRLLRDSNESASIREAAIHLLERVGGPSAIELILEVLADRTEDSSIRSSAASSLVDFASAEAVRAATGVLADPDWGVREAAFMSLALMDTVEAMQPLFEEVSKRISKSLFFPRFDLSMEYAIASLAKTRAPQVLDMFLRWLRGSAHEERGLLCGDIAAFGDPSAMPALVEAARSDDTEEYYFRGICSESLGRLDFSHPAITNGFIHARSRDLISALGVAPSYGANLLRLVHAAGAYSTAPQRNEIASLIWGWDAERAAGVTVEQLQRDFDALAGEADNLHGPADENALVHLYLARLLLAAPDASPARIAAAERHLTGAKRHARAHETVLHLMIAWLQAEAALRQSDPARAYDLLRGAHALLAQVRRPERELGLPLASYTLALSGYAANQLGAEVDCLYDDDGRPRKRRCTRVAVELLYQSEDQLEEEKRRQWLDEATATEMDLIRAGFAALAQLSEHDWNVGEGEQVLANAQTLPLGWAARQAELHLLEQLAEQAVKAGQHEQALYYAEQLALTRYRDARSPVSVAGADARTAAQRQIAALQQRERALYEAQQQIARTEHELKAAEREEDAGEQEKLEKKLQALKGDRAEREQALKAFIQTLKTSDPAIASLMGLSPLELSQLRGLLRPEQALVQYLLLEDKGYVFLMRGDAAEGTATTQAFDFQQGRAALEAQIERLRALVAPGSGADRWGKAAVEEARRLPAEERAAQADEREALRRALSTELLGDLVAGDALDGVEHLILIPNGPLHRLPWAALDWQGEYLAERFVLSQLGGYSLLPAVMDALQPAAGAKPRLWAFGDPTPPDDRWARLPWAKQEVTTIAAAHFPETPPERVLTDAAAQKRRLLAADLRQSVVHLAVHGEAAGPGRTHLVFSDGYLSDDEISGLNAQDSPLVVLSACESGIGEPLSGDEVMSLANAFLIAGARAVVSTLWPVPDHGTKALMTRFYAHRAAGAGKAAALAAAQRELINAGHPPHDWAGVVVTGL